MNICEVYLLSRNKNCTTRQQSRVNVDCSHSIARVWFCPFSASSLTDIHYTKPARGSSAGGGYSTAEDLLKFTIALKSNKLLSEAQTKRVLQGGLGVAGGAPGINAALEIDPVSGYTVIVLSNYDPPSATDVSQQIRKWIASAGE